MVGFVGKVPKMQGRYRLILPFRCGTVANAALSLAISLIDALLREHPGEQAARSLGNFARQLVTLSIDDEQAPIRQGTRAVIRASGLTSPSGRYVQLMLPAHMRHCVPLRCPAAS